MNSYNIIIAIIIFLALNINIKSKKHTRVDYTDEGYESLLEWGLNNSLNISDKIKLTSYKKEKQYISTTDIPKGELILDVPQTITLTIDRALSILNSDTLKTQYKDYIEEYSKSNRTLDDISFIQQSFLAYILYYVNMTKGIEEETEINRFYEFYEPLYYLFKDDLSHIPSFFNEDQIYTFLNKSSFGSFFELMNFYIMGEVNLFEQKIFQENITLEEYLPYRFLIVQKSYNISNMIAIVPFIDFIKRDLTNPNCKLVISKGHIRIKAIKDIQNGELITIQARKISNQYSLFFYGKINKELNDYIPSFIVPIITPNLFSDEGIVLDIMEDDDENKIDLAWPNYYELILPTYKDVAQSLNKDDSDYSCYGYILKYLNIIKSNYDSIHYDEIEDEFYDEYDSNNIIRIIQSEKNFLIKKIQELNNIREKMQKKARIIKNKKEENNEDL